MAAITLLFLPISNKKKRMKIGVLGVFTTLFAILAGSAFGQYPATGNKSRLGWQTTADGLVWRGAIADTATIDPVGLLQAWALVDTASGVLYQYRGKAWRPVLAYAIQPFDSVVFNNNEGDADSAELKYNADIGSLVYGANDGAQIPVLPGHWYVRNDTSVTLTKGTLVRAVGTIGASGRVKVRHMIGDNSISAEYVMGIVVKDIPAGEDGYIMFYGKIRKLNTNVWNEGDLLYPDEFTPGALTNAPVYFKTPIAFVVHKSINQGVIAVRIQTENYLSRLHDVTLPGLAAQNILRYSGEYWIPGRDTSVYDFDARLKGNRTVLMNNFDVKFRNQYSENNYVQIRPTFVMVRDSATGEQATLNKYGIAGPVTGGYSSEVRLANGVYLNGSNSRFVEGLDTGDGYDVTIDTVGRVRFRVSATGAADSLYGKTSSGLLTAIKPNYLAYTDTASMLSTYINVADTAAMLATYINAADTSAMLSTYINRADTASMLTNYINAVDTAAMLSTYVNFADTAAMLSTYINAGDTASMLANYINAVDTASMLANYINAVDTAAMLLPYLRKADTLSMLSTYINAADTAAMLDTYINRADTAAMLSTYINAADTAAMLSAYINASDTASMLTNYINREDTAAMLTNYINAVDTAAMLSTYINREDTASMLTNYVNFIDTLTTIGTKANLNLKLNAADTASLSNRINLKLNAADTASLSNRINLKLNATDTASLSTRIDARVRYTDTTSLIATKANLALKLNAADTASLSNRINLKLNAADTVKYVKYVDTLTTIGTKANLALKLNATDTASLSNRINLKLSIADTASMLSTYLRPSEILAGTGITLVKDSTVTISAPTTLSSSTENKGIAEVVVDGLSTLRLPWDGTAVVGILKDYLYFFVNVNGQSSQHPLIPDGKKGDIITSQGGATLTIDTGVVNLAKLSSGVRDTLAGKLNIADTLAMLSTYINREDTASMLTNYVNFEDTLTTIGTKADLALKLNAADTASLSSRINLKLNAADTASLSARINTKLNAVDTASLSNRINLKLNAADTASLSNRINTKLNAADTASLSTRIDAKQNTITGAATSITTANLTASRALVSDSGGKVAESAVTATELGYLSGVTSAIQTQLNGKQNTLTNPITGTGTANQIAFFNGTTSLSSLTTATYPNLTELSYVKGVTSAIQTQLNTKLNAADTASLSNRIDLKLNIADTAAMLSGYIKDSIGTVTSTNLATGAVTGAKLGSITSAELRAALTDETGTGAAVFSNSPIFTSISLNQNIGNATGSLNLTNNSDWEWSIGASGSSGTSSDLTISNMKLTGTRPLFIKQSNNYIGIGTDAPISRFHVVGKVRIDTLSSTPLFIAGIGTDSTVVRLSTDSLPSIAELKHVKGVTSAIQTQLNGKQNTLTNPITGTGTTNEIAFFNGSTTLSSLTTATYPSLTELSYVKGVTSAIQTQLNAKLNAADTTSLSNRINTKLDSLAGEVTTFTIRDTAVTTAKIATGAVTGVKLGSISSAQLLGALTDETGTGAAVFGTSPTMSGVKINGAGVFGGSLGLNYTGAGFSTGILSFSARDTAKWSLLTLTTSDDITFYNVSSATFPFTILSSNGNIGFSTSNPTRTLDVNGQARIRNLTTDIPTRIVGADADGDLGEISTGTGITISSGVLQLQNTTFATITGATYTVANGVKYIICDRAGTVTLTLPTASSWSGREIMVKTVQAQTVISAASNVVPVESTTAGTAILPATDGAWALLVSDGTNWIIMQKGQ